MCGIVGVCFEEGAASPALIAGLRSLEYRGYDSAGIALAGSGLPTRRTRGRVDNLVALVDSDPLPNAACGIAHTRWATHGKPSDRNSHPHRFGRLVAVHNGILENHEALRAELSAKAGHDVVRFESETDSEVWVALIDDELGDSKMTPGVGEIVEALARAMQRAKGSYALAIMHEAIPDRIFFARRESPLVVGIGEGGNYVASDIAALLELTHRFLYVEDGMLGWVSSTAHEVYDEQLQRVDLPVDVIEWDAEAVEKCGYEHFMLKEIEEQAIVVGNTLQVGASESGRVLPEFEIPDAELAQYERVVIVACGTALHAGFLAKYVLEGIAGIPVQVDYASEFRYREPMVGPKDLVLAISQSGETADTLGAMKVAIERGARPVAICNVRGSSLCRISDAVVQTVCGPEIGVASTKAFTAQLLAVHLLALRLGMARKALSTDELAHRVDLLRRARPALDSLIGGPAREHVADIARRFANKPIFFFLGRGPDYPIALEGALKLKEISYLHAEGYPAGEMKHGPLALVSEEMVCVAIAGDSPTYEKVLGNVQEVKTRGGTCVLITNSNKAEAIELADETIIIPSLDPLIDPILSVVPLQYLAYYVALERGCDIDKPRNLAKSVTVE